MKRVMWNLGNASKERKNKNDEYSPEIKRGSTRKTIKEQIKAFEDSFEEDLRKENQYLE